MLRRPARQQTCRSSISKQTFQTSRFRLRHFAPEASQAIVAAAFIIVGGVRPLVEFLDQFLLKQPPDGRVQAARAEAQLAVGPLEHVLHHGIAVPITIGKRHEDVKGIPMQRQERLRLGGASGHRPNISQTAIAVMGGTVDAAVDV